MRQVRWVASGTLSLVLLVGVGSGAAGAGTIDLENTIGGWRNSRQDWQRQEVEAAYPKPPVDRGGQRYRTMIRGRIAQAGKDRSPYRLIVNGSAMPLYTDVQGSFARPWAFGAGSNSVEVRSPDAKERKRVQFYEAGGGLPQAKMRFILTWDDAKAEVDLHVVTPDGQHAFWAHPLLSTGGGLDVDSVDGAGPEIFSTAAPLHGTYLLYVNYWGNFDAAGYNFDPSRRERPLITTMTTVILNENTVDEKRLTYVVPLRKIGDLVPVTTLRYSP